MTNPDSTTNKRQPVKVTHLDDYLVYNAWHYPDKMALHFNDRSFTWRQLSTRVDEFASQLALLCHGDVQKQQVVGLLIPNSWQYVVAYLAVIKLGHIAMPIDTSYKKLEIDAIVNQTKPSFVLELYESNTPGFYGFDDVSALEPTDNFEQLRLPAKQQIASLLFTSGTTGRPKAVPNTHANHIWNIKTCSQVWDWNENDTLLISLRLSHMYGLIMGLAGCLYHSNTLYLQDWFDPEKTLEALASGKISMFKHVPFAYQEILSYIEEHPHKNYDLSGVRIMISGGGPLSPDDWQMFYKKLGIKIIETYGSSESGRIAGNQLNDPRPGSPGYLLPGVRAKLSADSELLVKSPGVFPGYYHNQSATHASFTADGWWRTGDIAEIKDSRVILKGRLHERIRKFGYTISPRDVEWALLKNPDIKEAHVLGTSDDNLNDQLVYFIVGKITDEQLSNYCKNNLLFAWRPDKVVRLDSLPRTATGKPKIQSLREMIKI